MHALAIMWHNPNNGWGSQISTELNSALCNSARQSHFLQDQTFHVEMLTVQLWSNPASRVRCRRVQCREPKTGQQNVQLSSKTKHFAHLGMINLWCREWRALIGQQVDVYPRLHFFESCVADWGTLRCFCSLSLLECYRSCIRWLIHETTVVSKVNRLPRDSGRFQSKQVSTRQQLFPKLTGCNRDKGHFQSIYKFPCDNVRFRSIHRLPWDNTYLFPKWVYGLNWDNIRFWSEYTGCRERVFESEVYRLRRYNSRLQNTSILVSVRQGWHPN